MKRAFLPACAALILAGSTQGMQPIDGDAVRKAASEAIATAKGDDEAALRALDAKVSERWGALLTEPLSLSDAPTEIHLFSPYAAFRKSVAELLRRRQPIDPLAYNAVGIVVVAPARVDAPDVTSVVLQRNGENVPPSSNQLVKRPITSPMGVTRELHAGYVSFPLAAFAPGAGVTVTAVVDGGSNVSLTLDAVTLSRFR